MTTLGTTMAKTVRDWRINFATVFSVPLLILFAPKTSWAREGTGIDLATPSRLHGSRDAPLKEKILLPDLVYRPAHVGSYARVFD
jgi:hypothetical protein